MAAEAERLADAFSAFAVALRSNEGFQPELYERVVAVLRDCADAWGGAEAIPRLAVNILVDIVPVTQSAAEAYPQPTRQQILDASFKLYDLIMECVAVDPR